MTMTTLETKQDPKHVALRLFLDHPDVFDAAADMLSYTTLSSATSERGDTPEMNRCARMHGGAPAHYVCESHQWLADKMRERFVFRLTRDRCKS